jgi:hypothetical protein
MQATLDLQSEGKTLDPQHMLGDLLMQMADGVEAHGTPHARTSPPCSAAASFQKRKRKPTVGSMLLRWKKLFANPLFTCENMKPA